MENIDTDNCTIKEFMAYFNFYLSEYEKEIEHHEVVSLDFFNENEIALYKYHSNVVVEIKKRIINLFELAQKYYENQKIKLQNEIRNDHVF